MHRIMEGVVLGTLVATAAAYAVRGAPCASASSQSTLADHRVVKIFDPEAGGVFGPGIQALFQAADGRIWAGTRSGCAVLNKDETTWDAYTTRDAGMVRGGVQLMAQSDDGRLWFGQRGNLLYSNLGVASFDGERWSKHDATNSPLRRFHGQTYPVEAMFTGKDGRLWFVLDDRLLSYSRGLWSLEGTFSKLFHFPRATNVHSAIEDTEGHIWVTGSMIGVARLDMHQMRATFMNPMQTVRYPNGWPDDLTQVRATTATCLYLDRTGRIWVAADNHVYVYDQARNFWQAANLVERLRPTDGSEAPFNDIVVNATYVDREGQVMLGTNRGLVTSRAFGDLATASFKLYTSNNSPLGGSVVDSIMEDSNGRIWIGGSSLLVIE